jgi:hypothetical protein
MIKFQQHGACLTNLECFRNGAFVTHVQVRLLISFKFLHDCLPGWLCVRQHADCGLWCVSMLTGASPHPRFHGCTSVYFTCVGALRCFGLRWSCALLLQHLAVHIFT